MRLNPPKMKILILVDTFAPKKGYMEYYLTTKLVEMGNEVQIITSRGLGLSNKTEFVDDFRVDIIPHLMSYYRYGLPSLRGFFRIMRILKNFKPSLIICSPSFSPLSLIALYHPTLSKSIKFGSLVTGGPTIVTSGFYSRKSTLSLLIYIIAKFVIKKIVSRKIDRYLILAERFKKFLVRNLDVKSDKFLIMPLGADPTLFKFDMTARNTLRKGWNVSIDDVVITYTGQIHQTKDIPLLIEAFSKVSKEYSSTKLIIVGSGDDELLRHLKDICSVPELENKVLFFPPIHRSDLHKIYSASDIAIWPGGPSISIGEAASVGLPIIIKDSPMTSYFVDNDNGFTFKHGDVDDLSTKITTLLKDSELRTHQGSRSRELVTQRLNWSSIAKQLLYDAKVIAEQKAGLL